MPRSERCRIRGNCLHGIALPSLAQAPVAGGASGRRGWSPSGDRWGFGRAAGCRQPGSEDRWRGHGASDKAELEDDRGRAGSLALQHIVKEGVRGRHS
jgi:hypothetical protein